MIIPDTDDVKALEHAQGNSNSSMLGLSDNMVMIGLGSAGVFAVVGLVVVLALFIRRKQSSTVAKLPISSNV